MESMTVDVRRQLLELPVRDGGLQYGEPKSKAGIRKVAHPSTAAPLLIHHLETYVGPEQTACLFTGRTGKPLRPKALSAVFNSVRTQLGLEWLRFHDLRHFAATQAGNAGATIRDLMARGGWSSERMVLGIYTRRRIVIGRSLRAWYR